MARVLGELFFGTGFNQRQKILMGALKADIAQEFKYARGWAN